MDNYAVEFSLQLVEVLAEGAAAHVEDEPVVLRAVEDLVADHDALAAVLVAPESVLDEVEEVPLLQVRLVVVLELADLLDGVLPAVCRADCLPNCGVATSLLIDKLESNFPKSRVR